MLSISTYKFTLILFSYQFNKGIIYVLFLSILYEYTLLIS